MFEIGCWVMTVTFQGLASQVKRLQQQVDLLTSAFNMSVDLQHSLLEQFEDQAFSHPQRPNTQTHNMFASTPSAHILTRHGNQNVGAHPRHTEFTATHNFPKDTDQSCIQSPINYAQIPSLVPPMIAGVNLLTQKNRFSLFHGTKHRLALI